MERSEDEREQGAAHLEGVGRDGEVREDVPRRSGVQARNDDADGEGADEERAAWHRARAALLQQKGQGDETSVLHLPTVGGEIFKGIESLDKNMTIDVIYSEVLVDSIRLNSEEVKTMIKFLMIARSK